MLGIRIWPECQWIGSGDGGNGSEFKAGCFADPGGDGGSDFRGVDWSDYDKCWQITERRGLWRPGIKLGIERLSFLTLPV